MNGLKPIISIHYNPLYIVLFLFLMATSGVVFPVEEPPAEVVPSEDPPLSRKDKKALLRDYGKTIRSKSKHAERHRGLVAKWGKKGHLSKLIQLYEADTRNSENIDSAQVAHLHYGLGYAYMSAEEGSSKDRDFSSDAITQFEQAVQLDANHLLAHYDLGRLYQRRKQYDQALDAFERCLVVNPTYYVAQQKRGEIYLSQADYQSALRAFEATINMNPKSARAHYGLGLAYWAQSNNNFAREAFDTALAQDKKFAPARYKLAQVLAKEQFFDDALAEYEKASKYQPTTAELWFQLAVCFTEANAEVSTDILALTIELFQKALALNPQHAQSHFQLGEIFYSTDKEQAQYHYQQAATNDSALSSFFIDQVPEYYSGQLTADQARQLLDKSLLLKAEDPLAYFYLAQIEADQGNVQLAIDHYKRAIALDPEYADVYFPLGDLYYQINDRQKARVAYRQAIALDPDLETHFFEQGKIEFADESYAAAIISFDKTVLIRPGNIEATYLLGRSYEETDNLEQALNSYVRTVELDPTHRDALYRAATMYRAQGEYRPALEMLEKLIRAEPENVEAHYLLGLTYLDLDETAPALMAFIETTRLDPKHVDGHYQSGLIYQQQGDLDQAVDRYETVISLDQTQADPFLRLGRIYYDQGKADNVIRVWEPGLELSPNHPQKQYNLAAIFEDRDWRVKAIKHFGLANQYDPSHYDWHFRYARLLDRHAQTVEDYNHHAHLAVEAYSATLKLKRYALAYFYRGLIMRRYRQIADTLYLSSEVAADFKAVVEIEPKNADAHYFLGLTYLDMDNRDSARQYFVKTLKLKSNYVGANLEIGLIEEWLQNYKASIQFYEEELSIHPDSVRSLQRLGDLYRSSAMDFGKAKRTLEKAIKLDPNHVPTLLHYGNTLFNLDQLGQASEQFERALKLDPTDLTANYNLALMYEYGQKRQLAIYRWKRFLELNPPESWREQAKDHLRQLNASVDTKNSRSDID